MLEIYKNSAHFIGAANFQVTPWVAQLHLLLLLLLSFGWLPVLLWASSE